MGAATMQNSMAVPQNTRVAIWSRNPAPGRITRYNSNSERYRHPYSCWPNHGDHLNVPQHMNDKEDVYSTYTQWNTMHP